MSMCLIIAQEDNIFIGSDTACAVLNNDTFYRVDSNSEKLFTLGNDVFFCSGNMSIVSKCIKWIYNSFKQQIDIKVLSNYLKKNFPYRNQKYFDIEILLVRYGENIIYQLSQYNNYEIIRYYADNDIQLICGGYKTKWNFNLTKKFLAKKQSVLDVYTNVYNELSDECIGGFLVIYNNPYNKIKRKIREHDIKYVDSISSKLYLLNSDFVQAGHINGTQIIGGDIYSENYSSTTGTYLGLNNGDFSFGGGKIKYESSIDLLTIKGVNIEWSSSTTPEISDINGLSEDLEEKSANITANADAITAEVSRATTAESNLSSSIIQTAESITSTVNKQITETKEYADAVANTAELNANSSTDEKLKSYSTTTEMNSAITQTAESITSTVSKTYETKTDAETNYTSLQSQITQNANNIELRVEKGSIISTINQSAEEISINASKISLEGVVTANSYFKINTDGSMEATNGTFSGEIVTTSGTIGGFKIGSSAIYNGTNSMSSTTAGIYLGTNGIRQYASSSAYVNISSGVLTAKGANITGTITTSNINATGGTIGGINISSTGLYYSGSSSTDGFGIWKSGTHSHNGSYIIMHAGGNGSNIGGATFRVYQNGAVIANSLTATNATISGVLTAGTGSSLGGFKTDSNSIYYGSWGSTPPSVFMCTGSNSSYSLGGSGSISGWCFGAGSTFGVTNSGAMYCTSGKIGGWSISSSTLRADNSFLDASGVFCFQDNTNCQVSFSGGTLSLSSGGKFRIGSTSLTESNLIKLLALI